MNYPFSTGDLLCAGQTASTYLDNNVKVPWDDLRYLFGEILYGGHIVEDWDRRLSSAYLHKHFTDALLEGPELFPDFTLPAGTLNHKAVCYASPVRGCSRCLLCTCLHTMALMLRGIVYANNRRQ